MAPNNSILIELFHSLTDSWSEPHFLLAKNGDFAAANASAIKLIGHNKQELSQKNLSSIVQNPTEKVAQYLKVCSRNTSPVPGSLKWICRDGKLLEARCKGFKLNLKDKNFSPLILLHCETKGSISNKFIAVNKALEELRSTNHKLHQQDILLRKEIAEHKQANEEKANLESQLRHAHKMEAIGTMAGGIAHDFNNILAAVIGYADMALDDLPDFSPAKHEIKQVLKAGNRAKELVRHILTFSRMSGLVQGHVHIDLSPIIKEVLKFQHSIIPTTIEIRSDIDENCGQINGDPTQLHQILMNLCTNAAHAMEEKGGMLEVILQKTELWDNDLKTEPSLHPGLYIRLSVRDTGTGLTPELIEKIFDPYFTTKEVGKGSGMGLSVLQGIVKNHGGFVKVMSEPGEGSIFNVFFPRIEEKIIQEDNNETKDIPRGTEKILFVDDEEMLADVGKAMLERLGYSITAKTNSSEALQLFQNDPSQFDLVITDQSMPNMPGSELAKQLLQIRPDIPIIMCSGFSSTINEVKAQKIGIREYAMKPVNKKVIAKLIRKVLDGDESPG